MSLVTSRRPASPSTRNLLRLRVVQYQPAILTQRNVGVGGLLGVLLQGQNPEVAPRGAVVAPAGELYGPPAVVAGTVPRLGVAEVLPALVLH